MVIALIVLSLALVASLAVAYRLHSTIRAADLAPKAKDAASMLIALRDSGDMPAEQANLAVLALRSEKLRARSVK